MDRTPIAATGPGGTAGRRGSTGGASGLPSSAQCDVLVAEVGLEGLGCPAQLSAAPRLLALPGSLMPAQVVQRAVELGNPSRAPLRIRVEGGAADCWVSWGHAGQAWGQLTA